MSRTRTSSSWARSKVVDRTSPGTAPSRRTSPHTCAPPAPGSRPDRHGPGSPRRLSATPVSRPPPVRHRTRAVRAGPRSRSERPAGRSLNHPRRRSLRGLGLRAPRVGRVGLHREVDRRLGGRRTAGGTLSRRDGRDAVGSERTPRPPAPCPGSPSQGVGSPDRRGCRGCRTGFRTRPGGPIRSRVNLLVDRRRDLLGSSPAGDPCPCRGTPGVVGAVTDGTQTFGHAVLGDHRPGNPVFFDVVGGARRGSWKTISSAARPPKHVRQLIQHLVTGSRVALFIGSTMV